MLGDTSSPASNLAVCPEHLEDYNLLTCQFSNDHDVFLMFPVSLFAATIRINYLRKRSTECSPSQAEDLTGEAFEILGDILAFSPETWAMTKSDLRTQDFTLIGNAHQAAVALYCISSLQSVAVLPPTLFLTRSRAALSQNLHIYLEEALSHSRFLRLLYWPLVVLGMEAVNQGAAMRTFVQEKLLAITSFAGTHMTRKAKAVLEKFWDSGKTDWDSCFDQPYMFYNAHGLDGRNVGR